MGVRAVAIAWLAGLAEIGVDAGGRPCAVRPACVEAETRPGPVAICQGNFELVVLAVPAPADRLQLELACEAVPGQAHVYTITRRSAVVAERAGLHPDGALGMLRQLAGELPQNVERTVSEWVAGHGPPLRVRTAMMLDAGDPATAERLTRGALAGLVVERIGGSLLAFPAARLNDVAAALATAGRELAPGLDRISGRWDDHDRGSSAVEQEWTPRGAPAKMPHWETRLDRLAVASARADGVPAARARAAAASTARPRAPGPRARGSRVRRAAGRDPRCD